MSKNEEINTNNKVKNLSEYINLNLLAFQYLKDKNYKLSMNTFEKCKEIAKSLDEIKHIESLTNYAICQYFNGNFEESFEYLEKAKEISSRLLEKNITDKQIQFIHLRVIANLSLTALSLNKINECKLYFNKCLDLINSNEINNKDKILMIKELNFIFFRIESLTKYYEINNNVLDNNEIFNSNFENNNNNNTNNINNNNINKCLFGLHKSLRENNIKHWLNVLTEEINKSKKTKNSSGYMFLLINQMAANYCYKGKINENIKLNLNNLIKYYQETYNKELNLKEKNLTNIFNDFKLRFEVSVELYKKLYDLENEINNNNDNNTFINNDNKGLMKLLFKHALNYIKNEDDTENNDIKTQIITAIKLLENDEIDCSNISILNINNEITKSLKLLFENLIIIHTKVILREALYQFKFNTVGYYKLSEKMLEKYRESSIYLKTKLEKLSEGIELKKFHFSSKGHTIHFYKISTQENDNYNLMIYKKINDNKPMKVIPLSEILDITVGCFSKNLQKRLYPNVIKKYKPWLFLSIYFSKRTIDLYFEKDEDINEWFLGIYYYMWKIQKKKDLPSINQYFFNKLKLKLLYKIKEMEGDLQILEQIKKFQNENEGEYQNLPKSKTILLYVKICEKLNIKIFDN